MRKLTQIRGCTISDEDCVNATAFIEDNYIKYLFGDQVEKGYQPKDIEEAFKFANASKPACVLKSADKLVQILNIK